MREICFKHVKVIVLSFSCCVDIFLRTLLSLAILWHFFCLLCSRKCAYSVRSVATGWKPPNVFMWTWCFSSPKTSLSLSRSSSDCLCYTTVSVRILLDSIAIRNNRVHRKPHVLCSVVEKESKMCEFQLIVLGNRGLCLFCYILNCIFLQKPLSFISCRKNKI